MIIDRSTDIDELHRIMASVEASEWTFNENGELVRKPIHYPVVDGVTITIDGFVDPLIHQKA